MRYANFSLLILACCCALFVRAGNDNNEVNVDELKRIQIKQPDGQTVWALMFRGQPWQEIKASMLLNPALQPGDYHFEAKYDKLMGNKARLPDFPTVVVIVDEKYKQKQLTDLKNNGPVNMAFFGTVKRTKDLKGIEFWLIDFIKLPPDLELYGSRVGVLSRNNNADGLIEMGRRIDEKIKNEPINFNEFAKYEKLRDNAFTEGIQLKEQALKAGDADGCYDIARLWRDLLRRNQNYRTWILKCVQIDPNHPKGGLAAKNELGMEKHNGVWMERREIVELQNEAKRKQEEDAKRQKLESQRLQDELKKEVAERQSRLLGYQAALRTNDATALEGALLSFGEAIQRSLDAGFAEEAADILANLNSPKATTVALAKGVANTNPDARKPVIEALLWRLSQRDAPATEILSGAMKNEMNHDVARNSIDWLSKIKGKDAIYVLVVTTASPDTRIRDAASDALRVLTQQQLSTPDGWLDWWNKNKANLN